MTREEGDACNVYGCGGKLTLTKSINCSCHIVAPCSSCLDVKLVCTKCGELDEDSQEVNRINHLIFKIESNAINSLEVI